VNNIPYNQDVMFRSIWKEINEICVEFKWPPFTCNRRYPVIFGTGFKWNAILSL